jgi:hypothetical protein
MRYVLLFVVGLAAAPVLGHERPVMTSLPPAASGRQPPSQRALVDARDELKLRYRELLFRATSSAGAEQAAETFLEAAIAEEDRALKWLLMSEARRLGSASGNALVISRAITLASATYDFDALDMEYRSLAEIPLRGISQARAMRLAESAERIAIRAELDGRISLALSAQDLAIRAWQRAGAKEACRQAMLRHAEITAAAK